MRDQGWQPTARSQTRRGAKTCLVWTTFRSRSISTWYLGKEQVSPRTIETIREKLTPEAFEEFKAETRSMPAWMADTLHRYEQGPTGG
jgi:hypothetical protein